MARSMLQRSATQYDTSQRGVLRTLCNTTCHSTAAAKQSVRVDKDYWTASAKDEHGTWGAAGADEGGARPVPAQMWHEAGVVACSKRLAVEHSWLTNRATPPLSYLRAHAACRVRACAHVFECVCAR